ncbi:MAG: shikimate kinase AroL [Desulfovibrio sp.]|nr:shikimate kinase AroL [Desulfovibrio sp.]
MKNGNVFFLIGPRACGKTTLSYELSKELNCQTIDCDDCFTKKHARSIASYVESFGWEAFRKEESVILREIVEKAGSLPCLVVATGGGIVLQVKNRELMRSSGVVIYLSVPCHLLLERLLASPLLEQRPSLTPLSLEEEVRKTMGEREPLYRETADYIVDAGRDRNDILEDLVAIASGIAGKPCFF